MVILFFISIFISIILCLPAWKSDKKNNYFYVWEYGNIFYAIGMWILLTLIGFGPQSLGNLIEIPLLALLICFLVYSKSFLLAKVNKNKKIGATILFISSIFCTILIRYFFPLVPE